ncbi:hypothetical protein [Runella salmonicolor]|uniref:Uncharacterized protein n=1 Tax=Runella salmonicolor TaxID=2950278 RepID=A0ABT1FWM7_9BACT|nr:hypothetical protein [Runella salmonicolor]MCP1384872.1 hypothetical protein [Runella salmonicolor]
MGQLKTEVSVIQSKPELFNPIKANIKKFGCQAVADAAGLRCYQSVATYAKGKPVRVKTEERILEGLEKLNQGYIPALQRVNNIINLQNEHESQNINKAS